MNQMKRIELNWKFANNDKKKTLERKENKNLIDFTHSFGFIK